MEVTPGPCITPYVAGSACAVSNTVVLPCWVLCRWRRNLKLREGVAHTEGHSLQVSGMGFEPRCA